MAVKRLLKNTLGKFGYEIIKKARFEPVPILSNLDHSKLPLNIHYACGRRLFPDWLNVDYFPKIDGILRVNLVERHPFEDNFFELGFCEDFLEHLSQPDSLIFLSEVYRTLKLGGVCRFAFPTMDGQVELGPKFSNHEEAKIIKDEYYFKWGHKHLYAKNEFKMVCKHIGFSKVDFRSFLESNIVALRNLESREFGANQNYYAYVEITK